MSEIEREAFEKIERQFLSGNSIGVERAAVLKSDWEAAKRYLQARAQDRGGEPVVKPDHLRTAEENRRLNKLMLDIWDVYSDDDPDAQLPVHRVWHLLTKFEAEILAAHPAKSSEGVPEWIKCSERLPAIEDQDCNGDVWFSSDGGHFPVTRSQWLVTENARGYWMPTGLTRPEPPKEGE